MVKHLSGFNNKPKATQGVQEYFQELTVTRQASDDPHRDKIYQFRDIAIGVDTCTKAILGRLNAFWATNSGEATASRRSPKKQ